MGMRSQQLARQRPGRSGIAVEHQDAQIKSLRFHIRGMKSRGFLRKMDSLLIMHLPDKDGDHGGG
jgi:hypothetical protein